MQNNNKNNIQVLREVQNLKHIHIIYAHIIPHISTYKYTYERQYIVYEPK